MTNRRIRLLSAQALTSWIRPRNAALVLFLGSCLGGLPLDLIPTRVEGAALERHDLLIQGAPDQDDGPNHRLNFPVPHPLVPGSQTVTGAGSLRAAILDLNANGTGVATGLELIAPGCVVRGLAIHSCGQTGIRIATGDALPGDPATVIESCFIGTDPAELPEPGRVEHRRIHDSRPRRTGQPARRDLRH